MSGLRLGLTALLVGAVALAGCGRKGEPDRPPGAERRDPAVTVPTGSYPAGEGRPLEPPQAPAAPGPDLEDEVDEALEG